MLLGDKGAWDERRLLTLSSPAITGDTADPATFSSTLSSETLTQVYIHYIFFYLLYTLAGKEQSMALSIRNEKAEKLAREVAAISGENLTQAIVHSLEERLERLRGRRTTVNLFKEIMIISERCRSFPDKDARSPDEILGYNPSGAPE
jgi:antitoxin VapB